MGTFTLDDPVLGKLGGGQYATVPFRMEGEFRDLQLRWYDSVASQDFEFHYLELFMSVLGVDESLPS
jgi:hypothetical protein